MTIDTKRGRELLATHIKYPLTSLAGLAAVEALDEWMRAHAEELIAAAEERERLRASLVSDDARQAFDFAMGAWKEWQDRATTAERERDAALARAERAEKALGALADVAEDVDKYVDDRDASKDLREAVEAACAALKGGE